MSQSYTELGVQSSKRDYLKPKWRSKSRGWQELHVVMGVHDNLVFSFTTMDQHVNVSLHGRTLQKTAIKELMALFLVRPVIATVYILS